MTYLIVLFNLCWQYVLLLNIPKGEKQYLLKCIMQDLFTNSINTMRKHDTRVLYWIIKYETLLICQIYIQLQHILVTTVSSTYSQACSSTTNLSISSPWPSSAVTWISEFPGGFPMGISNQAWASFWWALLENGVYIIPQTFYNTKKSLSDISNNINKKGPVSWLHLEIKPWTWIWKQVDF